MFVWDRPPAFQGKITESEIESSPHSCKKVTLPPPLTLKFLLHLCLMSHAITPPLWGDLVKMLTIKL